MSKPTKTIPGIMWGIMDSRASKLECPNLLGFNDPCTSGERLVGTYFSALFYQKKAAKSALAWSTWPGARIVKLRVEEVE